MAENDTAGIEKLQQLMTPRQLDLFADLLTTAIGSKWATVTVDVRADRVFIISGISYDAGKVPDSVSVETVHASPNARPKPSAPGGTWWNK
jgi:hypothetical protein